MKNLNLFIILSKFGKAMQAFVLVASNYWRDVTPTKFGSADFDTGSTFWEF